MLFAAFLPEIAAAAVALVAVNAGDKFRVPLTGRNNCEEAKQKAMAWSYQPTSNGREAWRPVVREGSCCSS